MPSLEHDDEEVHHRGRSEIELTTVGDEEVSPLVDDEAKDAHGLAPGSASNAQVAVNIIISFVGAGLLGLPEAFKGSGWLLGSVALCIVSAINVYAMLLLPQVKDQLKQQQQRVVDSYGTMGAILLGPRGQALVNLCLVVSQTGFATAYIIFIAANLWNIAEVPRHVVCFGCIPGLACLVQATEMKTLSPFSLLADLANLVGLSAVLFEDWEEYEPHNDTIHPVRWSGLLHVIGITIYSMEGVGLILSLEGSCRDASQFPSLFRKVLISLTLFMAFFGSAGYMAFGEATEGPITLNLRAESLVANLVIGALCLALYLTYPVMMFPVWSVIESSNPSPARRRAQRSGLVVITAVIAYVIPSFGHFLALVGSSFCTILGFILPGYFHYVVMPDLKLWQRVIDWGLMGGGAIFAVLGTMQSMNNLIHGEVKD